MLVFCRVLKVYINCWRKNHFYYFGINAIDISNCLVAGFLLSLSKYSKNYAWVFEYIVNEEVN